MKSPLTTNILHIFEKGTDAQGTIIGFNYQYYKTLKLWLDIFHRRDNKKIFCETEDDIKILENDGSLEFIQIKCYSSTFSFKSEAISKSLYNFFILFLKYIDKNSEFVFETNTSIKPSETVLIEWNKNQKILSQKPILKEDIENKIKKILIDKFTNDATNGTNALTKKKKTLEKKPFKKPEREEKRLAEIQLINTQINEIKTANNNAILQINNTISQFVSRISWRFGTQQPEKAVEELELDCISDIQNIDEFRSAEELGLSRLLSEIVKRSSKSNINDRILDRFLLSEILRESRDQMLKNINGEIKNILSHNFKKMFSELTDIKKSIQQTNELKSVIFPVFEDADILDIIHAEIDNDKTKDDQSKLRSKIRLIKLDNDVENSLIELATEQRCSYLLYLEKLKLQNLRVEFESLKSLERKVKAQCLKSVTVLLRKKEFNSDEFWSEFQDELITILEKHNNSNSDFNFDENFVIAQMYQMAAECHLRWHKN